MKCLIPAFIIAFSGLEIAAKDSARNITLASRHCSIGRFASIKYGELAHVNTSRRLKGNRRNSRKVNLLQQNASPTLEI